MITVVTSGERHTDIDAFACAIAYAEISKIAGKQVIPVLPGPPTASLAPIKTDAFHGIVRTIARADRVVLVDVSDPAHIARFVAVENVREVYDHHLGHELFWSGRPDVRVHIERVGAAATLIWELGRRLGILDVLDAEVARVVAAAIVSNTVDLQLEITRDRDRRALHEAEIIGGLNSTWRERYFDQVDKTVLSDLPQALAADSKRIASPFGHALSVGQLELGESRNRDAVISPDNWKFFEAYDLIIFCCRRGGSTHFWCRVETLRSMLREKHEVVFDGPLGVCRGVTLRKMIFPRLFENYMARSET
jgi:hypothetical protein